MVHGAANEDSIDELCHLDRSQRPSVAFVVQSSVMIKETLHYQRHISLGKNVMVGDIQTRMDESDFGAFTTTNKDQARVLILIDLRFKPTC